MSSLDEWWCDVYIQWNIIQALKEGNSVMSVTRWMDLEDIVLSEVSNHRRANTTQFYYKSASKKSRYERLVQCLKVSSCGPIHQSGLIIKYHHINWWKSFERNLIPIRWKAISSGKLGIQGSYLKLIMRILKKSSQLHLGVGEWMTAFPQDRKCGKICSLSLTWPT